MVLILTMIDRELSGMGQKYDFGKINTGIHPFTKSKQGIKTKHVLEYAITLSSNVFVFTVFQELIEKTNQHFFYLSFYLNG